MYSNYRSLKLNTTSCAAGFGLASAKPERSIKPPEPRASDDLYNPSFLEKMVGPVEIFTTKGAELLHQ